MIKWIQEFREAHAKTKSFVFNWAIYAIALVASTLYCYARLDFVRSGKPQKPQKVINSTLQNF